MIKKSTPWVVLVYGIILIALGSLAYMKAGSKISFYSATTMGALLLISSVLMFCNIRFGRHLALAIAILLTATFSIRYSITHKQIPAILSVFSAGMLLFLLARSVRWKR